jgi:phenylpropionate dioxygenase-like ring-hydroxylating dioxygenase large terminal subunit
MHVHHSGLHRVPPLEGRHRLGPDDVDPQRALAALVHLVHPALEDGAEIGGERQERGGAQRHLLGRAAVATAVPQSAANGIFQRIIMRVLPLSRSNAGDAKAKLDLCRRARQESTRRREDIPNNMSQSQPPSPVEIARLVEPGRVHRRVYADPALFELEMARIFGRAWIFLAHESQVPRAGDYILTRLGREDIIVTRAEDGRIHGLVNRCAHRGPRLCVAARGNTASFVCPYHAWQFRLDGTLAQVPHRKSYPQGFDLKDPALSLARVARIDSYRGFVFGAMAADGPSLADQLGVMTEALDNLVDRSPRGEIVQEGGILRQEYRGNWKFHHENANDILHPGFVHESSVAAAKGDKRDYAAAAYDDHQTHTQLVSNAFSVREWEGMELAGAPGGHSYMTGFYKSGNLDPGRGDAEFEAYRADLIRAHGAAKAEQVLAMDRFNNLIWPNISINAQYQQIRVVEPIAVDRTVVKVFCFRLKGAPEQLYRRAVRFLTNLNSPFSMIIGDDAEIYERAQAALASPYAEWLDQSRGLATDRQGAGGTTVSKGLSELPIRSQFQAWLAHMMRP